MTEGIGFGSFKSLNRELFQTSGHGEEPEGGGDVGDAAESGNTVHCSGICYYLVLRIIRLASGNLTITPLKDRGLGGENAFDTELACLDFAYRVSSCRESVLAAQGFTDLVDQVVIVTAGNVINADLRWITQTSGTTAADYRNAALVAAGQKKRLGLDSVNGINDVVKSLVEDLAGITLAKEALQAGNFTVWVDCLDPAGHGGSFLPTYFTIHGVELAVDIANADLIEVHHGDVADT